MADVVKLNKAILEGVGSPTDAVGKVAQRTFELKGFFGGEAAGTAIAVDAVEFVVQPGTRLAEISSCDFAPRYGHEDVGHFCLHIRDECFCLDDCFHIVVFLIPPPLSRGRAVLSGKVCQFVDELLNVVEQLGISVRETFLIVADSSD